MSMSQYGDMAEHHDHHHGLTARIRHTVLPHSHDAAPGIRDAAESSGVGIRAAWIGLAGMMATAAAQLVIVAMSGSTALMADTVHNLGHAATTIPLVVAFRIGRRPSTRRYPYGLRRAEDLVGLFIGLVIAASAVWIIVDALDALVHPRQITNLGWVFAAGVVGFLGNEVVAAYRIRAGRRIHSAALIAEGQHARADGLSSVAVVGGVIGVWSGIARADAVVGLLIGLMILVVLVATMRTVVRRLMDGVEDGVIDELTTAASTVPGIAGVDRVRARWTGHRIEGDLVVRVAPDLSVGEAHAVADDVERSLRLAVPHLETMVVHVHPAAT